MNQTFNRFLLTSIALTAIFCLWASAGVDNGDVQPPDYYDSAARAAQKKGDLETMISFVDEGLKHYPDVSGLNELKGAYLLRKKNYDQSRFYLYRAIKDDKGNVAAKQMLVDVEEQTGNYSSAICYVNELLEVNPYWKGLWQRKINLYKKQGNYVQADHLLRRICQIYPNDSTLNSELVKRMEDHYETQRSKGKRDEAISSLRDLIEHNPKQEAYYVDLVNLLLQQGDMEDAIRVAGAGAARIPNSENLVRKKAGILAEACRYPEALAFISERMRTNPAPWLRSLYSAIELEEARGEARRDPYSLYGRIYGTRHTQEALDYLLNTSFSRGYDEDALYYIAEARKRKGNTVDLLYKEYLVHKRLGNRPEARQRIMSLHEMQPQNQDFVSELAQWKLDEAANAMHTGDYAGAIEPLTLILNASTEEEVRMAAFNRLYTCYYKTRRWPEALTVTEDIHAKYPNAPGYVNKRAEILNASGNPRAALEFVADTLDKPTPDSIGRLTIIGVYEEIATPYIKSLIENGAVQNAYQETRKLLTYNPSSSDGLRYAITLTDILKLPNDYDRYVKHARTMYPEDINFLLKQAGGYSRDKKYRKAIGLVRPLLDSLSANEFLVGAHSENSEMLALRMLKDHEADSAIAVVDSALIWDSDNRQLLYTKGLAFEAKHQYDSAYIYQSKYQPSMLEASGFIRHLNGLRQHNYNNTIGLEYLQGRYGEMERYGEIDIITAVATASYEHRTENNTYGGHMNYAGHDGSDTGTDPDSQLPGGVGIQLMADWAHKFDHNWSGSISAGWANKYFPQIAVNIGATRQLKNDWSIDFGLSYRRIETFDKEFKWVDEEGAPNGGAWSFSRWIKDYINLFSAKVGATKELGDFSVDGRADLFYMLSSFYVNVTARGRYFPLTDRRTSIYTLMSAGTAPEVNMIDNAMPGSFSKLNTSVGLGGTYMLNKNITIGVLGSWQTFYNQNNYRTGSKTDYSEGTLYNYRNLFNISGQLYISF